MKNTLFLCAENFPPRYEFLKEVFGSILQEKGYRFTWIMPSTSTRNVDVIKWGGNKVYIYPKNRPSNFLDVFIQYASRFYHISTILVKIIKSDQNFDAVQVRDDPMMGIFSYLISLSKKIPLIYQISHFKEEEQIIYSKEGIYGSKFKNKVMGYIGLLVRNFILNKSTVVLPISPEMTRALKNEYKIQAPCIPVNEGVPKIESLSNIDETSEKVRKKYNIGNNAIIYIGTINKFRKPEFMIDVMRKLADKEVKCELIILGSGRSQNDVSDLLDYADKQRISSNIKYIGSVEKKKVYAFIRACNVGISPFPLNSVLMNNSPIKTLEYMLMSIPVVASPIPDHIETVKKANAGYVVENDNDRFASAITKLLSKNKKSQRKIGARGRKFVLKNRTFKKLSKKVKKVYDNKIFNKL